jgi:hypothetical protein
MYSLRLPVFACCTSRDVASSLGLRLSRLLDFYFLGSFGANTYIFRSLLHI